MKNKTISFVFEMVSFIFILGVLFIKEIDKSQQYALIAIYYVLSAILYTIKKDKEDK